MSGLTIIALILGLGLIAWLSARAKAMAFATPGVPRPHSRPNYHAWYVAIAAIVPAIFYIAADIARCPPHAPSVAEGSALITRNRLYLAGETASRTGGT